MKRVSVTRSLTTKEIAIAKSVFKFTLPYTRIIISNGLGGGNRPFTVPTNMPLGPAFNVKGGKYVLHVGKGAFTGLSHNQKAKKLLIHELAHVWQGEHSSNSWNYVLGSIWNQALSDDAYKYDEKRLKEKWDDYGPEQQASIVEGWYADGMKREDLRFFYIKKHIWREKVDYNWITAAYLPKPLPVGTLNRNPAYPSIDTYLIPILENRYSATDVKGYTARVKKVEEVFRSVDLWEIRDLITRLDTRRPQDKVSKYFHDHLSTPVRTKLTSILKRRLATIL